VIEAAAEDPHSYDNHAVARLVSVAESRRGQDREDRLATTEDLPNHVTGYSVGGIGRRADMPYFDYVR
jgi:hypothetical protein